MHKKKGTTMGEEIGPCGTCSDAAESKNYIEIETI
jgi:hypothetical protein